jgi:hypothetical protein
VKRNYYYLVAGLQDITLDIHKLNLNQEAFRDEIKAGVHPRDYKLAELLFLPYDHVNLINLLLKNDKPFVEKGNFSKERLEENIKEPSDLPAYMLAFITAFKNKEPLYPDMSPENELTSLFYDAVLHQDQNPFLYKWFAFDLNIRNIMLALNARKYKVDYEHHILGTSEFSELIRKSHARDFGLGGELDYLDELITISKKEDVRDREKALDQLRWNFLEEETFFAYFTIEKILAFIIKLGMIERWLGIDKEHSNELFRKLLKELQAGYKLPETFTDK